MATFRQLYGTVITARSGRSAADALVEQDRSKLATDVADAQQKAQAQTSAETALDDALPEGKAFLDPPSSTIVIKLHGLISELPLADSDSDLGPPVTPAQP